MLTKTSYCRLYQPKQKYYLKLKEIIVQKIIFCLIPFFFILRDRSFRTLLATECNKLSSTLTEELMYTTWGCCSMSWFSEWHVGMECITSKIKFHTNKTENLIARHKILFFTFEILNFSKLSIFTCFTRSFSSPKISSNICSLSAILPLFWVQERDLFVTILCQQG